MRHLNRIDHYINPQSFPDFKKEVKINEAMEIFSHQYNYRL
jgi:hypothetical protein